MTDKNKKIEPDYYTNDESGFQVFDVIKIFGLDFFQGNVIKYVIRYKNKNGIEDLLKARTYIDQMIRDKELEIKK